MERAPDGDMTKKRNDLKYYKERDVDQLKLQQEHRFKDFAVDYSLWYITNYITDNPTFFGLILVHKPTHRPLIIIEQRSKDGVILIEHVDDPIHSVEYVFYINELDTDQGLIHAIVPGDHASENVPLLFEAIHKSYMNMEEVDVDTGTDMRLALMQFAGLLSTSDLTPERRIISPDKIRRRLNEKQQEEMILDNK